LFLQAQKHFKPEFLNRLTELVIFERLPQDKLKEVANVQMKGIIARVANKSITLCNRCCFGCRLIRITQPSKNYIPSRLHDSQFLVHLESGRIFCVCVFTAVWCKASEEVTSEERDDKAFGDAC
jgi:hypothetical protein